MRVMREELKGKWQKGLIKSTDQGRLRPKDRWEEARKAAMCYRKRETYVKT